MSTIPDIDEAEEDALLQSEEDNSDSEANITEEAAEKDDNLSDDDLEEDNNENLLKEYMKVLNDISSNTLNYDAYINLSEIAHKLNDLDKIRESYTLFSNIFPLASDIWRKYIQIESSICTSEKEIESVVNLYKKALNDYYSSSLALEFAEFLFKMNNDRANDIWSELIATYALDCRIGQQFFSLYRKYIEQLPLNNGEKLKLNIESYIKELRIPLYEMENSYIDFKILFEKYKIQLAEVVNWDNVDKYYKRAKEDLQKMIPFEEQLKSLNQKFYQEKANIYLEYIKMADETLEENVIQTLYERMITDCCLNEKCWLEYIEFILKRDEDGKPEELENYPVFRQSALDINNRALQNCTWSDKLYIKKLYILEEIERPKEEVQEAFEKALEIGFSSPEPYVLLWLEYLSYLRRSTDYTSEKDINILRKNFDLCWNTLGNQWGVLADCNCEILQFWGRLEYGPFQNPIKGKELWDTVLESSDNAYKSALWIEYIGMEMKSNPESARKLFKKALSNNLDNVYSIISAWTRFERCNGSQANLDYCQKYCENFLRDLHLHEKNKFRTQRGKPELVEKKSIKRKFIDTIEPPIKKAKNEALVQKETPEVTKKGEPIHSINKGDEEFRKPLVPSSNISKVVKDHENEEIDVTKDHMRIFLSNLDYNINEEEIKAGLSELTITNIDLIKTAAGRSRGFGYLELSSEEEVQKALLLDGKMLKGRPLYISSVLRDKEKRQKFKYSEELEPRKLFVKGLPYDITKEELINLFQPYGKVDDIRIVLHKSGKPKGIAYVEYENETSASLAIVKLDGIEIRDFKINVAISAPPRKINKTSQPISIPKMLGIGGTKISGSQKPRMNLIPTSVRKNIARNADISAQSNGNTQMKSNNDFRKLLNKQ